MAVTVKMLLALLACVLLPPALVAAEQSSGSSIELLASQDGWTTWSPPPEIAPRFHKDVGPERKPLIEVSGGGNVDACGCWRRPLPILQKDRRYRIEAAFHQQGVPAPGHIPGWSKDQFFELHYASNEKGPGWNIHMSDKGRYFVSLVLFCCFYKEAPDKVALTQKTTTLTPKQDKVYKQIAWDTVRKYSWAGVMPLPNKP